MEVSVINNQRKTAQQLKKIPKNIPSDVFLAISHYAASNATLGKLAVRSVQCP